MVQWRSDWVVGHRETERGLGCGPMGSDWVVGHRETERGLGCGPIGSD